ncbi:MAG: membrane protein [Sulfurovum sp. PC08-66]|nr:MAG: membrane protein [Sulfurovum sp. PC08-66]KIM12488.1 MAG: membrane protein [Sulfuricurvum sp. PC08-66]
MDWGKVVYVFFTLMSVTSIAGFLYEHSAVALFTAATLNLVSTILKLGVRNLLAAELLASSLVADLHLIPAFVHMQVSGSLEWAMPLAIGALIANFFSMALVLIESSKTRDEY